MYSPRRATSAPTLTTPIEGDPVIEALRGFAALLVMATHYTYLLTPNPGAWGFASTGVDLFFVLSGYVFAPYLLGKPLQLWPHLVRRFFRLYPLYLCALFAYAGLRLPATNAWDHLGVHLLMGHTLNNLEIANFYNPAFWSLPPELEYYLLLPLLAWAATRYRFATLIFWAAAVHLLLVAIATPNEGITVRALATVHAPGLLIEFMLGSLAYTLTRQKQYPAPISLIAGALVLTTVAYLYTHFVIGVPGVVSSPPNWVGGNIGLGAAMGYAFLVSGLVRLGQKLKPNEHAGLLSNFALLGQLSYGVYLFHNAAPPLLKRLSPDLGTFMTLALCVALTLIIAFALHHAIEKPMRNLGRKLSQTLQK